MAQVSTARKIEDFRLPDADALASYRESILAARDPNRTVIIVCHGTGCIANGAPQVAAALRKAIAAAGLDAQVIPEIKTTGCHGFCSRGPLVILHPEGLFYQKVKDKDIAEIVQTTLVEGKPVERLLYTDPQTGEPIPYDHDIPFYKHQQRIVLRHIGKIDPTDIRDTMAVGGYQSLATALTRFSSSMPCPPTSLNPAVMTTHPFTCFRAASSMTEGTVSAGTIMTARSMSSGISLTDG